MSILFLSRAQIVRCTNNETYFESRVYVFGNGSDSQLGVGEHRFPFSFALPPQLPTSFEGEFGSVRYSARATLLHAKPQKVKEITAFFTVNSVLDLNTKPDLAVSTK